MTFLMETSPPIQACNPNKINRIKNAEQIFQLLKLEFKTAKLNGFSKVIYLLFNLFL